MINKIKRITIVITIFSIMILPINASAKTLGQLKREYSSLEQKYNNKQNEIKQNEQQQSAASNRIQSIYKEIAAAKDEIIKINNEIDKLNNDIKEKGEEIKDLMRFFQVSEGESTYLEYIFSAKSITDFIYRLSVTEQLTTYNNNLINDMNEMIQKNKNNINALEKKQVELNNLQIELQQKLVVLNQEHENLEEDEVSILESVKASKQLVDFYIKAGCKENEDIATCAEEQVPADTQFWRPLNSGTMWSTWRRDHLSGGGCRMHAGVDISAPSGTPIYAVANGTVVMAQYYGGYGNAVVINHVVNGRKYTSLYGHMSSIAVSKGAKVTKNTVIGYVGSTGRSEGPHLHLNICQGISSCSSVSQTVDPGAYINFPKNKTSFSNRTKKYSGYYSDSCELR